jgi:hypothetical protein
MFPLALSLFDTALLTTIIVFMILYLIVLIKLKPSTEGEKNPKKEPSKQNIRKPFSTEQRNNSVIYYETQEEPAERVEAIEKPKPVSKVPVDAGKTESSEATQPSGCPHYYGYLGQHPKNTPIPNECLTCIKIMECLVGVE